MTKPKQLRQQRIVLIISWVITLTLLSVVLQWEMLCLEKHIFEGCYEIGNYIIGPIWIMFIGLSFATLPLYFLKEAVYKTWRTFALVALPVLILWIAATPQSCSGIPCVLADRESVSMFGASLFVLVSYIIFIYKSARLRKKD